MVIFKLLLFPFAVLYDGMTRFRNHLYTIGHKSSFRFQTMVIGVGNLNTGGSGKTPMIEYLVGLLKSRYRLATLSRGYGRKTKGIRFAFANEDATTLGDEPFQFFRKFGKDIHVTVGEERALAIPLILQEFPETDVVLLDDAFQHRAVEPQLSILLTEFSRPFYDDYLLPAGRLRESGKGAVRADIIVVTKCPATASDEQLNAIIYSIQRYSEKKPIFFSGLQYDSPVPFQSGNSFTPEVILVSGLANASLFEKYARSNFKVLHHFKFADHYAYTPGRLAALMKFYQNQKGKPSILTTEKDMVKLIGLHSAAIIDALPWFYLPVRINFLKNGPDFDKLVMEAIANRLQGA